MTYTYEVNLLCDGPDCSQLLTSDPLGSAHEARLRLMCLADGEGWTFKQGQAFCPACARKAGDEHARKLLELGLASEPAPEGEEAAYGP